MSPVEIHMVTSTNSRWRKIFSQIFACFLTRCLHRESLQHGNLCHWRHWTPWFICGARGNSLTIRHLVADVSVGDEFARLAFDFAAPDELALTAFHVTHLKQQTAQHKSTLWCRTVLVGGARFFAASRRQSHEPISINCMGLSVKRFIVTFFITPMAAECRYSTINVTAGSSGVDFVMTSVILATFKNSDLIDWLIDWLQH